LKKWYGKTDKSQWRLPYVWSNGRSSKRKKIFIRLRSYWRGAILIKYATIKLFSDGIKKLVKLWNRCFEVE
jgi:hypothetical protein